MRLSRRFRGERIPASATFSITKACQCACEHCSAVFYNHHSAPSLSLFQLKDAIRETVALGATTIILLGGEPLLNRGLTELIAAVPKEQASVILFTNGEFLTKKICHQLKQSGLLGAFVSLDSTDPIEHDHFRKRPGLFNKAIQGIENLLAADVLTGISSYLSPDRLEADMLNRMMVFGKAIGVKEVTFFDAIPSGRWLKTSHCLLKTHHRLQIKAWVNHYRKDASYPGISAQSTMTSEVGHSFCFAANTQFYLTAFGEMCPCDFTPLTIGRFPEFSIESLWHRMIETPPYCERQKTCRMQDPEFHQRYLSQIPEHGPFPYPLTHL